MCLFADSEMAHRAMGVIHVSLTRSSHNGQEHSLLPRAPLCCHISDILLLLFISESNLGIKIVLQRVSITLVYFEWDMHSNCASSPHDSCYVRCKRGMPIEAGLCRMGIVAVDLCTRSRT